MSAQCPGRPSWLDDEVDAEHALERLRVIIGDARRRVQRTIDEALLTVWFGQTPTEAHRQAYIAARQQLGFVEHLDRELRRLLDARGAST
jgi:hypothetical protein